jgi:hypothetical protein
MCTVGPALGAGGIVVHKGGTAFGPVCIHEAACSAAAATSNTLPGYVNCGNVAANCLSPSGSVCTDTTSYASIITRPAFCKCNCYLNPVNGRLTRLRLVYNPDTF